MALNREKYSFPVGKVDMMTLYPLDFEEFLWATDNLRMCELIKECYENFLPNSLHDTALDLYKTYLVVGGMPRAVSEYVETGDFDFVMAAWASVPAQLAKENHKFQYKVIKSGARL